MARPIRFRCWQKYASLYRKPGMYEVATIDWYEAPTADGCTGEVFFKDTTESSEYLEDVELMQYTGLEDKNGREMAQSDIAKIKGQNYECLFEIVWDDQIAGFNLKPLSDDYPEYLDWQEVVTDRLHAVEVVGDIYSNPELEKA